ncbi:TrmH family RNA methyltransferase, partial [Klebsiella pneumoniae]|uniref:TrmH family RNA methyltransferase n=1 Tax=Klebsiella pneumoniae TaxID=573 RepID=UPI003EE134C8
GAFETIPMVHVVNLANCIKTLKQEGYWVVGLDASGNSELGAKVFSKKTAIILGSEDDGMRKLTKEKCDFLAKIPISNQLNSLNVSNAA